MLSIDISLEHPLPTSVIRLASGKSLRRAAEGKASSRSNLTSNPRGLQSKAVCLLQTPRRKGLASWRFLYVVEDAYRNTRCAHRGVSLERPVRTAIANALL